MTDFEQDGAADIPQDEPVELPPTIEDVTLTLRAWCEYHGIDPNKVRITGDDRLTRNQLDVAAKTEMRAHLAPTRTGMFRTAVHGIEVGYEWR